MLNREETIRQMKECMNKLEDFQICALFLLSVERTGQSENIENLIPDGIADRAANVLSRFFWIKDTVGYLGGKSICRIPYRTSYGENHLGQGGNVKSDIVVCSRGYSCGESDQLHRRISVSGWRRFLLPCFPNGRICPFFGKEGEKQKLLYLHSSERGEELSAPDLSRSFHPADAELY